LPRCAVGARQAGAPRHLLRKASRPRQIAQRPIRLEVVLRYPEPPPTNGGHPAPLPEPATEWAGERDAILRDVAEKRVKLAGIHRKQDAGIHNNIWVRLGQGDFE